MRSSSFSPNPGTPRRRCYYEQLQLGQRRDAQLLDQQLRPRRAETGYLQQLRRRLWHLALQLLVVARATGVQVLAHLGGDRLADAAQLGQPPLAVQRCDVLVARLDRPRRLFVGAYAERVLAPQREQLGDVLE